MCAAGSMIMPCAGLQSTQLPAHAPSMATMQLTFVCVVPTGRISQSGSSSTTRKLLGAARDCATCSGCCTHAQQQQQQWESATSETGCHPGVAVQTILAILCRKSAAPVTEGPVGAILVCVFVCRYGRVPTLVWQEPSGQTSR
jgi:hypothetical protein